MDEAAIKRLYESDREYRLRVVPDCEEIEECDNCGYPAPLKACRFDQPPRYVLLCKVCSSTYLSHATEYPSRVDDPRLYKSLAWIANEILTRLPPTNLPGA